MDLGRIVESLLFATDRPLTPKAIAHILKEAARYSPSPETVVHQSIHPDEVATALEQLGARLESEGSSLMVQGVAGGFQLKTRPEFATWTNRLFDVPKAPRLSQPALETLAVVAYRQPIGRAEIESVRGVRWMESSPHSSSAKLCASPDAPTSRAGRCSTKPPLSSWSFSASRISRSYRTPTNCAGFNPPRNPLMSPNNSNSTSTLSRQMKTLRVQLDRIDHEILKLLQQRTKLSRRIGEAKRRHGAVIYVPERERELLHRVIALGGHGLPSRSVAAIYREILPARAPRRGRGRSACSSPVPGICCCRRDGALAPAPSSRR